MKKETLNAIENILEGITFFGYVGNSIGALHKTVLSFLVVANGVDAVSEYKKRQAGENVFSRAMRFSGPFLECASAFMLLRGEIVYSDTPEDDFLKLVDLVIFSIVTGSRALWSNPQSIPHLVSGSSMLSTAIHLCVGSSRSAGFQLMAAGLFNSVRGYLELRKPENRYILF